LARNQEHLHNKTVDFFYQLEKKLWKIKSCRNRL